MTPSEQCKAAGMKSLAELAKISNTSTRTLISWHRHNITRFTVLLAGAVVIKAANAEITGSTSDDSAWCDDCHGYTHKAGNPCADAKALDGEALPKENAILCSADEVDSLRKIEEAAKQIRADYQANRFSHENMMALIEAMRVPNV
jgi:hypothetical protein